MSAAPSQAVASLDSMADAPISFARGAPSPELIPAEELADCAHAVALKEGASLFAYGPGGGYAPLREWLAQRHEVEPGRVVLTIGGLLGFVLYAGAKLASRPGRVLVEGPTYDRPLKILAREGAEVVVLPMDGDGLDPEALETELHRSSERPSFLYTIPSFQNPSGRTLVEARRRRLVEIAREHDLDILEDDPYGLVRYAGRPLPTLHELEGGNRVTYTSSFSKTVAPGLRTGYFVLPAAEAADFEDRAVSTYISPPFLAQATIFEFLERGRFDANLENVRSGLRARRDAMLDALEHVAPPGVSWNRPDGGYFLWLEVGDRESQQVAKAAAERGLNLIPGVDFFPPGSGLGGNAARLAFSYEPVERIVAGVERLAEVLTSSA